MLIREGVGERLREERDRLGKSQTDFGEMVGVSRGTQKAYELGSSSPDIRYLSALQGSGVDVLYVITGTRAPIDGEALSEDEAQLVARYRALPDDDKANLNRLAAALMAMAFQSITKK